MQLDWLIGGIVLVLAGVAFWLLAPRVDRHMQRLADFGPRSFRQVLAPTIGGRGFLPRAIACVWVAAGVCMLVAAF